MMELPQTLPVLPLRATVLFPEIVTPVLVGRDASKLAVEDAADAPGKLAFLVAVRDATIDEPVPADLYTVGTVARIVSKAALPDGSIRVVVEGVQRARLIDVQQTHPYLLARVEPVATIGDASSDDIQALVRSLQAAFQKMVEMAPYIPDQLLAAALNISDPENLGDFLVSAVNLDVAERQATLETADLASRLRLVSRVLNRELGLLETGAKINEQVASELGNTERQFYLRRQLDAIRKELGELDGDESDIDVLRTQLNEANPPEAVRTEAERELTRLERVSAQSPEHTVIRSYLDWIVTMPWSVTTEDTIDVATAGEVLDEDHYGLREVKERILEFLAVRALKPDQKGPILCLVGPPGVGKTSLGQSIARALGRKFVRMSLGGVHDEAEIRGHRRTYIGAMPGRVVQSLRRAGAMNPLVMLDEIDKLGADYRGDPASALLEVLDPEQNSTFTDHYLDVEIDLSQVLFLTTANMVETIPPPLLDRMEVIRLHGYTLDEKVEIARRYLVPNQRDAHGLTGETMTLTDGALRAVIEGYTREAGVRSLDRTIAKLARKTAALIVGGSDEVEIDEARVRTLLKKPRFLPPAAEAEDEAGVATGLAVTGVGGDVLSVEAALVPGTAGFVLTGQLGQVMQESARAAYTYVRSRVRTAVTPEPGATGTETTSRDWWDRNEVHIHVPAGAVPKDGPSAGVTITTALYSAVSGMPVRKDVGMTGEVTLRGRVLPIGGLKEKVLAAHRAGLRTVVFPAGNDADVDDIPETVRDDIELVPVSHMDEVLAVALVHEDAATASAA